MTLKSRTESFGKCWVEVCTKVKVEENKGRYVGGEIGGSPSVMRGPVGCKSMETEKRVRRGKRILRKTIWVRWTV